MRVIDLFCGCGGLSLGFLKDNHTIVKAVEFDKNIAAYLNHNHPDIDLIVDDIRNVDNENVFKTNMADIIIGGPPCQGFSMAGARIREGFIEDPRNFLFKSYFNVVKCVKPRAFVFENVKGILTMEKGQIFQQILDIFSNRELLGGDIYNLFYKVVKASDYGIPQDRERVIIIGIKNERPDIETIWENTKIQIQQEYPHFLDNVTIRDAIGNLPDATENGIINNPQPISQYQQFLSCNNNEITNHNPTKHSALAVNRMERVGNGENFTVLNEDIKSVHSGSYGRLSWDDHAQTITTRFDTPSGGRFTHPDENRTITPREAARIQSFPDDFVFYGNRTTICKQIGNAVPPKLAFFLSKVIDNCIGE